MKLKVKAKIAVFIFVILCMNIMPGHTVGAADDSPSRMKQTAGSPSLKEDTKSVLSKTSSQSEKLEEFTLNDLNDTAILLSFIREQCINIYEETAREPVRLDASPQPKLINTIPVKLKAKEYLPARQEWLVFYLGVMEPVIRELVKDTKDIQSGSKQLLIPESLETTLRPLWESWTADTQSINKHLDELVPLFDDTVPNSEGVRQKAVAVYEDAGHMEGIRRQIFVAIRNEKRAGNKDKIMISPP